MQTGNSIPRAGDFVRTLSRYAHALDIAWRQSGGAPVHLSQDDIVTLAGVHPDEQVACRRALVAAGVLMLDRSGPLVLYVKGCA